jgi:ABC-2 type transport system ATP-binding protein
MRSGAENAIVAHGLSKSFGDVRALVDVDLTVPAGTVLGLLGPNGAGKTTMVRILATLLPADTGTATVAGRDIAREAGQVRSQIGLAGQYAAVDENLTGFENLELFGLLYHLGREASRERAAKLLERFDLTPAAKRAVKTYSGGMRRRLDLAAALIARPPVIFLDEPTTGLDPRARLELWEIIEARVSQGSSVLLTTQYLDEADRLADRIAVIDRGRVIAEGTPDELKESSGGERLEVTLSDGADPDAALAALAPLIGDEDPQRQNGSVSVPIGKRQRAVVDAVRLLDAAGVGVEDVSIRRPTLDDVFMSLTGHAADTGEHEQTGDEQR